MAVLVSPPYQPEKSTALESMVEIGSYNGVLGTMWSIVREEGTSGQEIAPGTNGKAVKSRKKAEKRGQGIEGLWRGWRVGMWGLVGVWTASAMSGGGNSGGEF